MKRLLLFIAIIPLLILSCNNKKKIVKKKPISFTTAKKWAETKIYYDNKTTFYCYCCYNTDKTIDKSYCGYSPRNDNTRAKRMEWEHIVPAARFGKHRACWQQGRAFCRTNDMEFRAMESDLMNLVPSVGELNADRSNRPFGEIPGEPREYGDCDFEVDFTRDVVEPDDSRKGDIARIYLYMYKKYPKGLPLTSGELAKFKQWSAEDPEDDWEIIRKQRIIHAQGN